MANNCHFNEMVMCSVIAFDVTVLRQPCPRNNGVGVSISVKEMRKILRAQMHVSTSTRYPVGKVAQGSGVTLYHETSNADDILARLRDLTRDEPDKSDLRELASRGVLSPFARLETQRRSYRKGEVNIVVDATDWGYRDEHDEGTGRISLIHLYCRPANRRVMLGVCHFLFLFMFCPPSIIAAEQMAKAAA